MLILILSWIVFGLVVGLIARAIYPGPQSMGVAATILLGVAGSFVGGTLANALFGGGIFAMHAAGFVGSVIGALVLLALMVAASRTRRTA
jgi:uncharacterized membrane protein YeaQ/YmgE (transglycosylase-associated protein family)